VEEVGLEIGGESRKYMKLCEQKAGVGFMLGMPGGALCVCLLAVRMLCPADHACEGIWVPAGQFSLW
jgi:hypothetical protein